MRNRKLRALQSLTKLKSFSECGYTIAQCLRAHFMAYRNKIVENSNWKWRNGKRPVQNAGACYTWTKRNIEAPVLSYRKCKAITTVAVWKQFSVLNNTICNISSNTFRLSSESVSSLNRWITVKSNNDIGVLGSGLLLTALPKQNCALN